MRPIWSGNFASSCSGESDSTKPQLLRIWTANCGRIRGYRQLQKAPDMNIVTEPHIAGEPIADKPRPRPVRMLRWFIIIGSLLAVLVVVLVGFDILKSR